MPGTAGLSPEAFLITRGSSPKYTINARATQGIESFRDFYDFD